MEIDIMQEFPLLSSWKDNTYWTGFISSQSQLIRLAINTPSFPSCQELVLKGDADSMKLLKSYQQSISQMVSPDVSLIDFLRGLMKLLDERKEVSESSKVEFVHGNEYYMAIFQELEQIGSENVERASSDFNEISLKVFDPANRKHIIRLHIPPKYPNVQVKVAVDLPIPSDSLVWPKKIPEIYELFKSTIAKFVLFWDAMDELDSQTRVIDPIQPQRGDFQRRILMNSNVVIQLTFDPLNPRTFPQIQFSGPERSVQNLEALLDQDCKEWSESKSVLENLEDILQCTFLPKQTAADLTEEEEEVTCVICYSFEFDGKVPETNCECGSVYHDACLSDLYVNDMSVKTKRLCVDCPVCGLELKVSNIEEIDW